MGIETVFLLWNVHRFWNYDAKYFFFGLLDKKYIVILSSPLKYWNRAVVIGNYVNITEYRKFYFKKIYTDSKC